MIKRGPKPKRVIVTDYKNKDEFIGIFDSVILAAEELSTSPVNIYKGIKRNSLVSNKYEIAYMED